MFKLRNALLESQSPLRMVGNLSNAAAGIYAKVGLLSSIQHSDGVIQLSTMDEIGATDAEVQELIDTGLLAIEREHFQVIGWEKTQITAAQAADNRRKTAERMARLRAKGGATQATSGSEEPVARLRPAPAKAAQPEEIEETVTPEAVLAAGPRPTRVDRSSSARPTRRPALIEQPQDEMAKPAAVPVAEPDDAPESVEERIPAVELQYSRTGADSYDPEEMTEEMLDDLFDELLEVYPRKKGNGRRGAAFDNAVLDYDPVLLVQAAKQYAFPAPFNTPENHFHPLADWLDHLLFLREEAFRHLRRAA